MLSEAGAIDVLLCSLDAGVVSSRCKVCWVADERVDDCWLEMVDIVLLLPAAIGAERDKELSVLTPSPLFSVGKLDCCCC